MKSSTTYTPASQFALLLQGPPKCGKTTFACAFFPKPYVLNCDGNLAGAFKVIEGLKSKGLVPKEHEVLYDDIYMKDDRSVVPENERWVRFIHLANEALQNPRVETIVADSLLTIVPILISHILKEQTGKLKVSGEPVMERSHWQPFRGLMVRFVTAMRSSGKKFIMTCHEEVVKDDVDGILRYRINMPSKLQDSFGGLFTDCWRITAEEVKGEFKNRVRTLPNVRFEGLGTTLGLPNEFNFSWEEFQKYLKGEK